MRRAALALTAALLVPLAGCDYTVSVKPAPMTTRPAPTSTVAPTTAAPTATSAAPTTAPSITVSPAPTTSTTTVAPTTTTTQPSTTPDAPVTTVSPTPSDSKSAAQALGWGKPTAGDEFDGTSVDRGRWGVYDGEGHGGNGRRSPSAFSVADGVLTVTGDERGTTGGMAWRDGQYLGHWEMRMRAPAGDSAYHPVLLLWPEAEDWPVGGEVDYAELFDGARQSVNFFLHYGRDNRQTSAKKALDATQWHTYAVEWTASCVVGYVDAQEWFRDCERSHIPPRAMHATIQLDWFPDGSPGSASMQVDYVRIWEL